MQEYQNLDNVNDFEAVIEDEIECTEITTTIMLQCLIPQKII